MKIMKLLILAATLAILVTCAAAEPQKKNDGAVQKAAAKEAEASGAEEAYVIGPEDVLNINVWKEPELTAAVQVRPDGKISLPLVNDIQAAGLTPMSLTADLTQKLKKFIDDPRVSISVNSVHSRRVYILGQVGRPGAFPLPSEMTVLQALSTAGGLTPYAAADKVYVLRNEDGKQVKLPFHYKQVIKGRKAEENIVLKSGDTVVVP